MTAPDVLVVGAGPTGLTLACEALRHGLTCRVVEELEAPVVHSKAAVVHTRTMEVFDDMGVVDAVLGRATAVHGINAYSGGKRVAHVVLQGVDSPYPCPYGISQRETELLLAEHLTKLGGVVERGKKLESLELEEGRVVGHVAAKGGAAEAIEARWIVGCDGAHSVVRKQLGFTFEGAAYEERIVQADVHVAWPMPVERDEIVAFCTRTGPSRAFPSSRTGATASSSSCRRARPRRSRRWRCSSASWMSAAPPARSSAIRRG
jgi:2-polyprenyl-6-methoxyphenol hydroxylase-like FAD-dependent oxidoreductase